MFIGFGERSQGSKVMNKLFEKSRGQVFVLYTLALVALLGALALGTDVAVMYVNWQQAQKVADAAALAGANYLSGGITYTNPTTGAAYPTSSGCNGETSGTSPEEVASQVACTYAVNNGLAASTVTISNPTSTSIQVVANQAALPYFFGKALGLSNYTVTASASAAAPGPVETVLGSTTGGVQGLFPVGLQCAAPCGAGSLVAGEHLTFGTKFISATVNAPGNWDWLGPDGRGASAVGGDITNGASGTYKIGDPISTAPGNKGHAGPIKNAYATRMASCPALATDPCSNGGNPNDIPAGDPCLVIMPAVDFTGAKGGSSPVTIEQFAEVYLEPDSTSTTMDGCFISTVMGGTLATGGTGTGTITSFGPSAPPTLTN
jgi:Flp pilus assembly protein TadG